MTELVSQCPLCGSTGSSPFDQRKFRGEAVSNRICHACGLVYQSPRMTEAESKQFYEAEYRLLYQGQESPNPEDLVVQTARARITLDFVRQYIKTTSSVLDIGCSTGILLQQLRSHYQAAAYGIEPGNLYRQYARSTVLEVYPSLEELQSAGPACFSLVSMMHVLEHLPDPVEYLQRLHKELLEPYGWLLLEVPNLYAHDCFEVAHCVSYSPHTLAQVVQKAGYRPVALRTHGLPRSGLLPLYITILARPDNTIEYKLKPERLVWLHRQAGFIRRRIVERFFPNLAWISPDAMKL